MYDDIMQGLISYSSTLDPQKVIYQLHHFHSICELPERIWTTRSDQVFDHNRFVLMVYNTMKVL